MSETMDGFLESGGGDEGAGAPEEEGPSWIMSVSSPTMRTNELACILVILAPDTRLTCTITKTQTNKSVNIVRSKRGIPFERIVGGQFFSAERWGGAGQPSQPQGSAALIRAHSLSPGPHRMLQPTTSTTCTHTHNQSEYIQVLSLEEVEVNSLIVLDMLLLLQVAQHNADIRQVAQELLEDTEEVFLGSLSGLALEG